MNHQDFEKILETGDLAKILEACFQDESIDGRALEKILEGLNQHIERGAFLCFQGGKHE